MKKIARYVIGALMLLSLAACTPTPQKASEQAASEETPNVEDIVQATTGGAADKVPDPTAEELTVVSIYVQNDNGTGLSKAMDAVNSLDAQQLVDKMIEYGALEEGTKVSKFEQSGTTATLDLSKIPDAGTDKEKMVLTSIVNTFTENFELDSITVLANGSNYNADSESAGYVKEYKELK